MNFKKKINLSIIILIILGLALIYLLFFLFSGISNVSNQITSEKQNFLLLEKRAQNSEAFRKFHENEEENFKKLDEIFIDPETPEFINFLEKILRESGFSSFKISPSSLMKDSKDNWSSIVFQINVAGPSSNFQKFLEKLESSQYLIEVRKLNVIRLTETELKTEEFENLTLGDIKADLSIKVYAK